MHSVGADGWRACAGHRDIVQIRLTISAPAEAASCTGAGGARVNKGAAYKAMSRAREGSELTSVSCGGKGALAFSAPPAPRPPEPRSQILVFPGPLDCHSLHQWVPLKQGTGGQR